MSKEDKKKPIFGLDKIPDEAYIKALEEKVSSLEFQLGQERSYTEELSEDMNKLTSILLETDLDKKAKILLKEKQDKIVSLEKSITKLKTQHKKDLSRIINQKLTRDERL